MKEILRVNAEEELGGIHDDAYREYYQDRLFTGIGYLINYLGQVYEEQCFEEGVPDGYCRKWWGQGQLLEECFYEKGYPKGVLRCWHENGQLHIFQLYEGGRDSIVLNKVWDIDGNLIRKQQIKRDSSSIVKKHMLTQEWYASGEIKLEELYEFGILCEKKVWNKAGILEEHFQIDSNNYDFESLQQDRQEYNFPNPFTITK